MTKTEDIGSALETSASSRKKDFFKYFESEQVYFKAALLILIVYFQIIDRKKDLVKLQYGEYVSLGKVESELKTCALVDNVCIYADPTKLFPVALMVPNPDHLKSLAEKSKSRVTDSLRAT